MSLKNEGEKPGVSVDLENEIAQGHFRVAIFGSARIKEGDSVYRMVYDLSRLLAAEGMDIVTGGGPGLMDAASRGHHAGRGATPVHSIGLNIRIPKEQMEAFHLDLKKDFSRFSERLDHFMVLSNAAVIAPGGVGTLLEFFYTWQLMQVRHVCHIPLILLGEIWEGLVHWIRSGPLGDGLLDEEDAKLIFLAKNCYEAFSIIKAAFEEYQKGQREFCLNHKLYRVEHGGPEGGIAM